MSFSSRGEHLYYTADTVLYPLHLEYPGWLSVYDILPDEAEASKRKVFDLVSRENALVIGQHFVPFPSLGHLVKKENGWLFQPIEEQEKFRAILQEGGFDVTGSEEGPLIDLVLAGAESGSGEIDVTPVVECRILAISLLTLCP